MVMCLEEAFTIPLLHHFGERALNDIMLKNVEIAKILILES